MCTETSLNVVAPVDRVNESAAIRQKELKVLAGLHQFLHTLANLTGISRRYMRERELMGLCRVLNYAT